RRDELLALVQALAGAPLALFYTVEKLLEQRLRDDKKATAKEWLLIRRSQAIFEDVRELARERGGSFMTQLSGYLQELAALAWRAGLRGRSLEKNSLMTPLDEVLRKLTHASDAFDEPALRAAIVEDIFEYLQRVAGERYRPGRTKFDACQGFVDTFFTGILQDVYGGNRRRLLADEKLLRSAFLFYIRQQIPRKEAEEGEPAGDEATLETEAI
ncbi:MAG TPA: hypothetical protein VER55_01520, partial [Ardenticatenaceae bacterium]|nr:hypothetical protein [Ardenticatenaceae bacterium]